MSGIPSTHLHGFVVAFAGCTVCLAPPRVRYCRDDIEVAVARTQFTQAHTAAGCAAPTTLTETTLEATV